MDVSPFLVIMPQALDRWLHKYRIWLTDTQSTFFSMLITMFLNKLSKKILFALACTIFYLLLFMIWLIRLEVMYPSQKLETTTLLDKIVVCPLIIAVILQDFVDIFLETFITTKEVGGIFFFPFLFLSVFFISYLVLVLLQFFSTTILKNPHSRFVSKKGE